MNGKTLKYLAGVCELARLDLEAAAVTIRADMGIITAGYAGNYARGHRSAPYEFAPFSISVSASRFKVFALMFGDDEEIRAEVDTDTMRLTSRQSLSRVELRRWGQESDFAGLEDERAEFSARMNASELISEVEVAAEFVADSQVQPVYMNIRIDFGKTVDFQTFDGGGARYISTVKTRVKGRGSVIVPTQDFLLGARLIGDGDAVITQPRGSDALYIYNDRGALFRSPGVVQQWGTLRDWSGVKYMSSFNVESGKLRNLVASAKALSAGPDISVKPSMYQGKSHVTFGSESEAGNFAVAVAGEVKDEFTYGAETLGKVVRLGPVLTFTIPEHLNEPTIVESEHRRCLVVTRI